MAKLLKFLSDVRAEAGKVTWPGRKETGQMTAMVLVMVTLATIFFFGIDQLLGFGVRALFGVGV